MATVSFSHLRPWGPVPGLSIRGGCTPGNSRRVAARDKSRLWQLAIARAHRTTNARARPSAWAVNSRGLHPRQFAPGGGELRSRLCEPPAHVRGGGCVLYSHRPWGVGRARRRKESWGNSGHRPGFSRRGAHPRQRAGCGPFFKNLAKSPLLLAPLPSILGDRAIYRKEVILYAYSEPIFPFGKIDRKSVV